MQTFCGLADVKMNWMEPVITLEARHLRSQVITSLTFRRLEFMFDYDTARPSMVTLDFGSSVVDC